MRIEALITDLSSGDDERAEAAAQALASLGAAALPALGALLSDPDEDSRWWAVRALAESQAEGAGKLLVPALGDSSPAVRQAALLGIRLHPQPGTIPLLAALLGDADGLCAAMAADALVGIGADAVPALLEVMESGAQPARLEAARALAEIGDPRAIPALFKALDDDSALIEYWASQGLEKMGVGMAFFKP